MSIPTTQKVVLFDKIGDGYDNIKYTDAEVPAVGPHDLLIKNHFTGVNFIEAYFRKGYYPSEQPYIFGREASGEIVAVGAEVSKYQVGDKVAYLSGETFAQYTKVADSSVRIAKLDSNLTHDQLKLYGAILTQGLTALTFTEETHNVQKGEFVLVWAASGGVGRLIVQLAKNKGGRVIAIASTDEKLKIASSLGAEFVINSTSEDIVARVKEITNGQGVAVSFDSVGKDSFEISLEALARKGSLVSYGNSSGLVPPVTISRLSAKNIKLTRPQVTPYVTTQEEWDHYTGVLFKEIESGRLDFDISKTYQLKDYAEAAKALESRQTTGKLVLEIPQ
ncbi:NADPH:quinone reductase [Suhomyces tanzawaensis NRRL Y-17324]|uniref:Probable quinone oxidoreductase n=1 Tax=Suhomyces tanzawaensis NRRL Y-17324 TaxID=984487 RepID=A0A1E4SL07_9ASCO|nr:NADPH:quinone reductase [Suhomyces tanzawaensis NRRL Y-17324]ODV80183.1 NADPH:quinone reductase [Suhomyces tanzawaensis NRRL Y-17324]